MVVPLDTLFHQYAQALRGYLAQRLDSPELAADLCQEIYLRLRRIDSDHGTALTQPRAYLFRIARNLLIDHHRQCDIQPPMLPLDSVMSDLVSTASDPEQAVSCAQSWAYLQSALTYLPVHVRQALLWHRLEGLTQREIGQRLGVSERMAGRYIFQAQQHCERLRQETPC